MSTGSYHPNGNSAVGRVKRSKTQMLSMAVNKIQNDWDEHLPHVQFAYNNSVSTATGLGPNYVHIGRLPQLPLTVFERLNIGGHQRLNHDILVYYDIATDRHRRACNLVRELHTISLSRLEGRNYLLATALYGEKIFAIDRWVWLYNTSATTR